jgi:Na+-transporting methylmalonyl-CoA/oxaloacetate decarboxylase gamma subunit
VTFVKQFLITVAGVLVGLILFLVIAPMMLFSSLASSARDAQKPTGDLVLAPAAAASGAAQAREALPQAVRLVITLDGHKLTRDIALGPTGQ